MRKKAKREREKSNVQKQDQAALQFISKTIFSETTKCYQIYEGKCYDLSNMFDGNRKSFSDMPGHQKYAPHVLLLKKNNY